MVNLVRIAILSLCGAAGVALAWYVARLSPASAHTPRVRVTARGADATLPPLGRRPQAQPDAVTGAVVVEQDPLSRDPIAHAVIVANAVGEDATRGNQIREQRAPSAGDPVLQASSTVQFSARPPMAAQIDAPPDDMATPPQLQPPDAPAPITPLPPIDNQPAEAVETAPAITPSGRSQDGRALISINTQNEDLRAILEMLSRYSDLNILAGKSVEGTVSAVLNDVDVETALEAILKSTGFVTRRDGNIIHVGTPQEFETIDRFHAPIDTRIYRPNYVTAAELSNLITPLLTPNVSKISVSSPAEVGIASDTSAAGGDDFAGHEAILVQDYVHVLEQVDRVVAEVDRRPMQVAIEAMILSVRLEDEFSFGIDWDFLRNNNNVQFALGTPPTTISAVSPAGGLTFAFLDSTLGNFIEALETIGDTNVIATPRLMCLDKQRAEILIGAELGYVSTTVTETSTTQTVDFLEVGTQLRLRPFISSDGLIRLEVHPELSTGFVRIEDGVSLPEKEVTQVTTNIMVRDGCTVIIGGLLREDLMTDVTQLPLLGNLPWVGGLFRQKTEQVDRREILVLITPNIVREPDVYCEGDDAAREFHRRHAVVQDHSSPIAKRQLGRTFFRRAQAAWAAGDQQAAMRLIRTSLNFDPTNRAAIDLCTDITAGRFPGNHTGEAFLPPAETIEGESEPAWILEEIEQPPGIIPPPAPDSQSSINWQTVVPEGSHDEPR